MKTGKVKWFDPAKGYGFITPIEGGVDIFVHASKLQAAGISTLEAGYLVEFEQTEHRGKLSADNLKLLQASLTVDERPASASRLSNLAKTAGKSTLNREAAIRDEFRELVDYINCNFIDTPERTEGFSTWGCRHLVEISYGVIDNINIASVQIRTGMSGYYTQSPHVQFGRDYSSGRYYFWSNDQRKKFYTRKEDVERLTLEFLISKGYISQN